MQMVFVLGLPIQMVVTDVAKSSKNVIMHLENQKGVVSRYTSCVVNPE